MTNNGTKPVIATTAITGFVDGDNNGHGYQHYQPHGYDFNTIFHGTRMADGFHGVDTVVWQTSKAAELATEKTGAATQLTIEKTAAAGALATEKAAAAQALAIERTTNENHVAMIQMEARLAAQAAADRAAAAECCCELKALILAEHCETRGLINRIDADNAKVALQNATNELLALKYSKGNS